MRGSRRLLVLVLAAPAALATEHVVWLPYASGRSASCVQGAFGTFTHGGIHAWDFALAEGQPIVAAAPGRVIRVIDDRDRSGRNAFDESNQVFIDHGGGIYATYLHHRARSARVAAGQLVAAGAHLADVGRSGTLAPHIHFDVRGPSWHLTHPVAFRAARGERVPALQARSYVSVTPVGAAAPAAFADSTVRGDEFEANGVRLRPDPDVTVFRWRAEQVMTFRGELPAHADRVHFYLWQDSGPTEYSASAPARSGAFELAVRVPASLKGQRWYRITTTEATGRLADRATLPVQIE